MGAWPLEGIIPQFQLHLDDSRLGKIQILVAKEYSSNKLYRSKINAEHA